MIYLTTPNVPLVRDAMVPGGPLGQIVAPARRHRLVPGVPWAVDNGAFSNTWTERAWRLTLEGYAGQPLCLFAVVPDVVCDARATANLWDRWADTVRGYGFPTAFVTQNGCTEVPPDADAVFTGGDNAWKLSDQAQQLAVDAKARGRWTHMGRVNSMRRVRFAFNHGYDSADGSKVSFAPTTELPRVLRYMRRGTEPTLWTGMLPVERTP